MHKEVIWCNPLQYLALPAAEPKVSTDNSKLFYTTFMRFLLVHIAEKLVLLAMMMQQATIRRGDG